MSILLLALAMACAVVAAHLAARDPRYVLPLVATAVLALVPMVLARRRMRRLLMSGDVTRVLGAWSRSLDKVSHPETMAPLLVATAYASYGWHEAARGALERAARGPAWDGALEQRLFVETLLDTFEGNRKAAVAKAEALELMPLPETGLLTRRKVASLRAGVAALARAFAHQSRETDERVLEVAAKASPLVHWAMRYARAIVAVDRGRAREVAPLLEGAPTWPEESAFREYHEELLTRAGAAPA